MGEIRLRELLSKKFVSIMKQIKNDKEEYKTIKNIRIALLGDGSLQYFAMILEYCLKISEIHADILLGTYNGLEMDVMDVGSEYNKFAPEITIIFTSYRDVIYCPQITQKEDNLWNEVWREIGKYEKIWTEIYNNHQSYIMQTNFVTPIERRLGNLEANYIWSEQTFLELLNYGLTVKRKPYVSILDFNYLAAVYGKEKWFDYSNYYLNKCNMAYDALPFAVEEVTLNILNYCGKSKKCIVLDLDNTIWGGVLEETGIDNLNIFPNDPVGEAFLAFQKYLKALKERGVILAICSKNDEEYAKKAFNLNHNMILQLDDISCFVANWENKANNIQLIAQRLNIGLDAMVFIDDSPVERELVRTLIPEVEVLELPEDPAYYMVELEKAKYFEWLNITEDDTKRTDSYKAREQAQILLQNYDSYEKYLESLEMKIRAEDMTEISASRTAQLFNKTNQFNTVRFRGTEAQIQNMQNNGDKVINYSLKDRFANYGMISCAIVKIQLREVVVEAWAMSCRVFKRTLEEYILNSFIKIARDNSCEKIKILYIPNERNRMIEEILSDRGFDKESGTNYYFLDIEQINNFKTYIKGEME